MAGRGRPRRYTAKSLEDAAERYFLSISRQTPVTEAVQTERRDSMGHVIYEQRPVLNSLGEEVMRTEYFLPPSIGGLCESLGIDKSTWANYSNSKKHPEFARITERVKEKMQAWNEQELLTREGKDLKGIIFNLEHNYGYGEKASQGESEGIEEYLKRLEAAEGDTWL